MEVKGFNIFGGEIIVYNCIKWKIIVFNFLGVLISFVFFVDFLKVVLMNDINSFMYFIFLFLECRFFICFYENCFYRM